MCVGEKALPVVTVYPSPPPLILVLGGASQVWCLPEGEPLSRWSHVGGD